MSFRKNVYHIVFATYRRERTLQGNAKREMHSILYYLCKSKGGFVYRIGGMEEHVHILVDIPTDISVREFVRYIKSESSKMAGRKAESFPLWCGWQEQYSEFTVSWGLLETVRRYVMNQEEHHRTESFHDEYRRWLIENGIDESEPYFPK